jgi:hypothetical protein
VKQFKAKVKKIGASETIPMVYINNRWRIFGVPIVESKQWISWPVTMKNAKRAANSVAETLGITLTWEEDK